MRHFWEGFLQLSLISIPIRACNAAVSGQSEVRFHQIHRGCGGRIRYKKVCEIHGEETKNDIILGHEYEKNRHEIEPTEIAAVRAKKDEQINNRERSLLPLAPVATLLWVHFPSKQPPDEY